MKLLIETTEDNMASMLESTKASGITYIEGPFAMAEDVNRNQRKYPKGLLEQSVDRYIKDYVDERRALGELNHPKYPFPDPAEAAIIVESLSWKDNYVMGKARVLDTPKGQIIKALWEAGFKGGVSTRGLGDTKKMGAINEVTKYFMNAIDVVDRPSGQACYVNALTEATGGDWELNEATGVWTHANILSTPEQKELIVFNEQQFLQEIEDFIKKLKTNK